MDTIPNKTFNFHWNPFIEPLSYILESFEVLLSQSVSHWWEDAFLIRRSLNTLSEFPVHCCTTKWRCRVFETILSVFGFMRCSHWSYVVGRGRGLLLLSDPQTYQELHSVLMVLLALPTNSRNPFVSHTIFRFYIGYSFSMCIYFIWLTVDQKFFTEWHSTARFL